MKYLWMTVSLVLIVSACSQINRDSQDYYFKGSQIRHGIVPVVANGKAAKMKVAVDSVRAKRGKRVYEDNCLSCHGSSGRGDGPQSKKAYAPPRDLVDVVKNVPNFKFFIMASRFQGEMPGWRNVLTDRELLDLEHYIRSMAK